MLFHVADAHGVMGVLPNFDEGETWESLHGKLHKDETYTKIHEH